MPCSIFFFLDSSKNDKLFVTIFSPIIHHKTKRTQKQFWYKWDLHLLIFSNVSSSFSSFV